MNSFKFIHSFYQNSQPAPFLSLYDSFFKQDDIKIAVRLELTKMRAAPVKFRKV